MKKKIIAILLIVSILSFFAPRPVRAGAWGEDLEAAWEEVTLDKILDQIEKTLVANLKIMAIRVIQGRLQVLLTGSCGKYCIGGSSGIITDWQDYVFGSAQRTAESTVNTFFNGMRSGVGSGMERVVNNAQKRMDVSVMGEKADLQNYVREGRAAFIFDPTKTTNSGTAWLKAAEPRNDLAFIYLRGYAMDKAAYDMRVELRKTKGVAGQGFTGTEKKSSSRGPYTATSSQGGKVTVPAGSDYTGGEKEGLTSLPGSVMKDITSEVNLMGVKITEFAGSIQEVVASMVVQTLTNLINYGIRQVTDPIDKSITDVRNKVGTSINQTQSDIQQGARESIYFNKKKK